MEKNDNFSLEKEYPDSVKEQITEPAQSKRDYSFSSQEKKKAEKVLRKAASLSEEFDLTKINDIDFLVSIFAEPYDKFKSLPYLTKMREKLLKRGYPESPILNEYLFWTTISRRLQIEYQMLHAKNTRLGYGERESLSHLKTLKSVAEQITLLQKALNETLERFEKISGIADLHQETLDEIEKFLQEHIGEYSFSCRSCGAIVSTQGLPHWAIEKHDEATGEKIYFVFSPEMWYLYKKKLFPLAFFAFILRTSVEGVLITAKERGERIPKISEFEIESEENKSKRLLLEFQKAQK